MTGYRATQLQRTIPLPILQMKADVLCQSGPGDRTPAWLVIPKSLVGRAPAMVCLHGTSGGRGRTAGVGADYPRYTLELAERGCVTVAPDYTLPGDNQTDPEAYRFVDTAMGFTPANSDAQN